MVRKIVLSLIAILGLCAYGFAQNRQVSGTVADAEGKPVAGATVLVDGTTVGTTTNASGQFTISAPTNGTLLVTFIGYEAQRVAIAGKSQLKITMKEDAQAIDDVIVVAYGTAKKEAFTGSASVMKSEDIGKRQVSNISNALAGAVAGVQAVSSNGQPGESAKIRIRGIGSISASSAPLYIVDGAPYDGSLSYLNSADIESLTVLKDAAASAIYGARGANGVVLITTKKGKSGDAKVNFDAKWGTNSRGVPNYDVISNPGQYYELGYQSLFNSRYQAGSSLAEARAFANSALFDSNNGGTGYNVYTIPAKQTLIGSNGKLNPNATLGYSDGEYYYIPDDWYEELFGKGNLRQEYNVSIAGASDRFNYFMSAGYLDDSGIIENSGFTRYSARLKADYQAKKWLKVGANISYSHAISNAPTGQTENDTGSSANLFYLANMIAPIYPMYVRDVYKNIKYDDHGNKIYDSGVNTNQTRSFSGGANPMISIDLDRHRSYTDAVNGNWFATVTPIEGLNFTANISASAINRRLNRLYNSYYGSYIGKGSTSVSHSRTFGVNQQYLATYKKTFADKHNFDVLVGFENYSLKMQYLYGSNTDLYNPNIGELDNAIYETPQVSSYTDTYFTMGVLSRLQYDYDGKYIFEASARGDGSSRFAPNTRWGYFPAASIGWRISDENFMRGIKWIDDMKFRASVGQTGNAQIGNSEYLALYGTTNIDLGNGLTSQVYPKQIANNDLGWEKNTQYNVGVDISLWRGLLGLNADYYYSKTTDMLFDVPVSSVSGLTTSNMNIGSMQNRGVELSLSSRRTFGDFSYAVSANWSLNRNKVLSLGDENADIIKESSYAGGYYITRVGQPVGCYYLMVQDGIFHNQEELDSYPHFDTAQVGDFRFVDANGNGILEKDADRVIVGNYMPDFYYGFSVNLSWKGFDLAAAFQGVYGNEILNLERRYLLNMEASSNMMRESLEHP